MDFHLTFIADDWEFLVRRQGFGPDVYLEPFKEHLIAGPALIFKGLLAVFGLSSAAPFYVASIALFLSSVVLLFVYLRRRVGDWLALLGAVSILFLGAAFEDFLWISPMNYYGTMVAGLAMLLALDRRDKVGDRIACAALVVSIAFSSLGLAFAAGALFDLAFGRRPRLTRSYIAIVPLVLYGLWWLGWGHNSEGSIDFGSIWHLPSYIFRAAGAGVTSLLGLASNDGSEPSQPHLIWGELVLIVAVVAAGARVALERRPSRDLLVVLAIALAFWVLTGIKPNLPNLAHTAEHSATSSRYQYISAVFLLLVAAEILRGMRIPAWVTAGGAVVVGLTIWGGVSLMYREYSERWRPASDSLRSSLAAVEIAGSSARPDFRVVFPPAITVSDATYLDAVTKHGTPAFSEKELEGRPEAERAGADLTIAQALGLALHRPSAATQSLQCQGVDASAQGATGITLLHGGFTLENRAAAPLEVELSRFAEEFSVNFGPVQPGVKTALTIPPDSSVKPWTVGLLGDGPARLCTTSE
jgi:hypothetical protein